MSNIDYDKVEKVKMAPALDEVQIQGGVISAPMGDSELRYEAPAGFIFDPKDYDKFRKAFWSACLFGSRPWQIAQALNDYFGCVGLFSITPRVGVETVQLR